jgi:hypothetical protein
MELSTNRLEAPTRVEERAFGQPGEERRQRAPRRQQPDPVTEDEILTTEEAEDHQLDDLA